MLHLKSDQFHLLYIFNSDHLLIFIVFNFEIGLKEVRGYSLASMTADDLKFIKEDS